MSNAKATLAFFKALEEDVERVAIENGYEPEAFKRDFLRLLANSNLSTSPSPKQSELDQQSAWRHRQNDWLESKK